MIRFVDIPRNLLRNLLPSSRMPKCRVRRRPIRVETLEDRTLLAVNIVFDYTYDTNGFFNVAGRKTALEMAGRLFEDAFSDTLSAIVPSGGNTWNARFDHPQTGTNISISNPTIPANEIRIYVGARDLPGTQRGEASFGWNASGFTQSWFDTIEFRGNTGANDVGPWGGSIAFDSNTNWHAGVSTQGLASGQSDLYSIAVHEIGHILGISGGVDSWENQISGGLFNGTNAKAANGGVGLPAGGGHLQDNLSVDGQEVSMSPIGTSGTRAGFTRFDWAIMDDVGWDLRFNENSTAGFGHLVIQVVNAQGTPLAGKQVTISGAGTIVDPNGTTDQNGLYSTFVGRGNYNVTVDGGTTAANVTGTHRGVVITTTPPPSGGDGILLFEQSTRIWKLATNAGSKFNWTQTNPLPANTNGRLAFVGDFNGDDLLDGMLVNRDTLRFTFYRNTGTGTLASPVPAGGLSTAVNWGNFQVGDYDGDGRDEVLAQILSGPAAGSIRTQDFNGVNRFYVKISTGYQALVTGDFNGDGADDLVGLFENPAGTQTNTVQILSISTPVGRRMTALLATGTIGVGMTAGGLHNFLADDFNGDGRDDLALRNSAGQVFHATTTGAPRSEAANAFNFVIAIRAPRYAPADFPLPLLAGRFNNDARTDLFGFRTGTNGFWVALSSLNTNPGDGIPDGSLVMTQTGFGTGVASQRYVVGDFNDDGRDDVVALNASALVFQSNGSVFGSSLNFGAVIGGGIASNLGAIRSGRTS